LQELRTAAALHEYDPERLAQGESTLALFLQDQALISEVDDLEDGARAVTLLTLHTAKGLEFPVVFIAGLEDGILPHNRSIESGDVEDMEEERRLCYVGITRAKRRLYLVHAMKRGLWGSTEAQRPSRFLDEIPMDMLAGMVDRRSRRESAYQRETSWGSGDGRRARRHETDDVDYSHPSSSRPRRQESSATYWSPSGSSSSAKARPAAASSPKSSGASNGKTRFKRLDSVQHVKFGVGTVIESRAVGSDEEVTVAFPGVGAKTLLASLANLKKL
jgi:DNA helicase-2/ATP-dependent DNA helicase PcrA